MKTSSNIKLFLLAIIVGFTFQTRQVFAQEVTPEVRAMNLTLSMNCELGLHQDQFTQVNAINLEAAKKMDAAKKQAAGDAKKLDKLGKKVDEDRNIKLRDVLTPSQYSLYEKISRGDQAALKKTAECRKNLSME
jgi:hypothetical protein